MVNDRKTYKHRNQRLVGKVNSQFSLVIKKGTLNGLDTSNMRKNKTNGLTKKDLVRMSQRYNELRHVLLYNIIKYKKLTSFIKHVSSMTSIKPQISFC